MPTSSKLIRIAAVAVLSATAVLLSGCETTPEQDPTVQKLTELDSRLLRIERLLSNQSLLDQSQRVDAMQNDLRSIRGAIEELQHNVERSQTQQREMYGDLDKRLQALEGHAGIAPAVAAAGVGASVAAAGASAAVDGGDKAAYQAAFDLLRDGKYPEAITALKAFQSAYPQSPLNDNAHYWLGRAYFVQKDYTSSLASFKRMLEKYPESRNVPDALLRIGYCQSELKNWSEAKAALNRTVREFADTPSARLATQQLAKLEADGH
jgi:tol-pal system protein YbgF